MITSNENLWQAERHDRRRLLRWIACGLSAIIFLVIAALCWMTQPLLYTAEVDETPEIDAKNLETHVRKLSEEFYPRNYKNYENLDAAAEYIKGEFAKTGGRVTEQAFDADGRSYRNIALQLGPAAGERIVIGAHYDSAFDTPGADDNASGVAALIEIAHSLNKTELPKTVEMVAYSLEEPPFFGTGQMGSFHHAKALSESGAKVKLMICLEMVGYFSDEPGSQRFPVSIARLFYPGRGNFISVVGGIDSGLTVRDLKSSMIGGGSLPVYSMNAPSFVPGLDFSDHRNYRHFGYNAIMITDSAFYRNHAYHHATDTAGRLNYRKMAEVVKGVHRAVRDISR